MIPWEVLLMNGGIKTEIEILLDKWEQINVLYKDNLGNYDNIFRVID